MFRCKVSCWFCFIGNYVILLSEEMDGFLYLSKLLFFTLFLKT